MIEAGKLRHRIRVERFEDAAVDSNGDTLPAVWELVKDGIPAAVEPLSAREFMQAQAIQSNVTGRVTIRTGSVPSIEAKMRFVFRGKPYNIAGVIPDKDSGLDYVTLPYSVGLNPG